MDNFDDLKADPGEAGYLAKVFSHVSRARQEDDELKKIITEEYDSLSRLADLSKIQESASIRITLRARELAKRLINERGDIDVPQVQLAVRYLKNALNFPGPNRQYDTERQAHMLRVLEDLLNGKQLAKILKNISHPFSHKTADTIIRETLDLPPHTAVTDAHTRRAALSALLTYLRQSVGSCFATAPAIILQGEQPEQFLTDINEMLSTGRLKRVYGGVEYIVPISVSWGVGDLRKPIPLKSKNDIRDISASPGLMAGLIAAGIVQPSQKDAARKQIASCLAHWNQGYITGEEILKTVIMEHVGLTEKMAADYKNRPRDMVFGGLMALVPEKGQKGSAETNQKFLSLFEAAKSAFKILAENALLKTWEFTIASFAETKADFAKWNLYSSLGLNPEEPGGIGFALFETIKRRLEMANRKVQDFQTEYEALYGQLKYVEGRMRSASTEREVTWLKAEYQSRMGEFQTFEEMRNREHRKAERLSHLFNDLIDAYLELFPRYFQEVYDAEMHDVGASFYDDRPAGFRLLYKHGRANSSQWTRIETAAEFQECLSRFFAATESEFTYADKFAGLEQEISEMVTSVVIHVKTKEFIESAFWRMADSHRAPRIKNPLDNLDKIEKKPWAYTSGGNIETLISCYFNLPGKPRVQERWVENPNELLVFLTDAVKQIPYKDTDPYAKNPFKGFLMHSPTHAFTLHPGYSPFKEAWQNESFTYTWLRDTLVRPMERFFDLQFIDEEKYRYLINALSKIIAEPLREQFLNRYSFYPGQRNPAEFRDYVKDDVFFQNSDQIDGFLFETLPLHFSHEIHNKAEKLLRSLPDPEAFLPVLDKITDNIPKGQIFTPSQLIDLCLSAILLKTCQTSFSFNHKAALVSSARELGYLCPTPIFFADTNWTHDKFAFVVNPGTLKLDFWRVDPLGIAGSPISPWKGYLNGSIKDPKWGVFIHSHEYRK